MKDKIIRLNMEGDYRIIAISDVHGHKLILERLLEKVQLREDDVLVLIGDFINRGIDSFETYRYVRELSKRPNTYVLKGNHEYFIEMLLRDPQKAGRLLHILQRMGYETVVTTLLKRDDKSIGSMDTGGDLYSYMQGEHAEMLSYFANLPIMLETEESIFVHGGFDASFDPVLDEGKFLKFDDYNDLSAVNQKQVIVGHWPACNLRYDCLSNVPYFNHEKNIIFIDGGLGVKRTGELNALVVEKNGGKVNYDWIQENGFEKRRILHSHRFELEDQVYVNYPFYGFDILERGPVMSRCLHHYSQKEFSVFNSLLTEKSGAAALKTSYVNNFLNLDKDEEVVLCLEFEDCALVKTGGEFGWVLRSQIKSEEE